MGDIHTRPFSKNYSGLINQSVIALGITVVFVSAHEVMKRRRRGDHNAEDQLGSRESWEFGYLYQGRSWARFPSPPSPKGWPLSWARQAVTEAKIHELRGIDATLYIRFLRGCFWFALLHAVTTFLILFPIHIRFADISISPKSMTRASISSLVGTKTGLSLLWIHICLLFWITLSWIATLLWICNGVFKLRSSEIDAIMRSNPDDDSDSVYYPHPHPQFNFTEIPEADRNHPNKGLRCRTVMVSNVPPNLRNEKELKEYFEYYMSRKVEKPSMGLTSSTQPGFFNKSLAFLLNRAKRLPTSPILSSSNSDHGESPSTTAITQDGSDNSNLPAKPLIERVTIVRKMTELASLLERREEILRLLETAHIKLANKTVSAVKDAMEMQSANKPLARSASKAMEIARKRRSDALDLESGAQEETLDEEACMEQLIQVIGPFVKEFEPQDSLTVRSKKTVSRTSQKALNSWWARIPEPAHSHGSPDPKYPPQRRSKHLRPKNTIWDALLKLPRSSLDAYQPLVNLEHVFRGQVVPSIDYYTTKLNLLTTLITEQRSKPLAGFEAVSTAFVTFADPADTRRACKYLAVHPNNPLACLVTLAPTYSDLDWIRVMKSSFNAEFVKDWVVNLGVWGFTLFWLFPVSLLVGLVSIQNISVFWPSLKKYLDHHPWQSEVIQSFLPTLLVALLTLLIPLILLLIAKKAHTITTLSALQDRIMTRYYKFLIVNVVVFFCVGTAALQSVLQSSQSLTTSRPDVIQIVAHSFPSAGPFYVGWLIFTTAMHGCFELALFGLPLLLYPNTRRQVTPRKRAVGTRPRTFNFYYWLPNHMLVIHVLLLFSVLNPFVLPFGVLYFFVQYGVIKNQLVHVYAKHYEGNGQLILIRIVRYSLDGLVLTQAVFLAYMVVLKKSANVGLSAFLIAFTVTVKVILTRMCRAQFEKQDILEADLLCDKQRPGDDATTSDEEHARSASPHQHQDSDKLIHHGRQRSRLLSPTGTWKLPDWINFSYSSVRNRPHQLQRRPPIPFGPYGGSFSRLHSMSIDRQTLHQSVKPEAGGLSPRSEIYSTERVNQSPKPRSRPQYLDNMPVVPHPSPIIWDDQKNPDLPYDNPFYTRAIDNILWLPRNPCGLLNLDDTVDMKTSLTVEVAAGQLGSFPTGLLERISPGEMSQISFRAMTTSSETVASPVPFSRELQVDGTEEIELPATIAKRIQAGESDVEYLPKPRKTSGPRGRLTSTTRSATGLVGLRPSSLGPSSPSLLSADGINRGRERSPSIMSTLQLPFSLHPANFQEHEVKTPEEMQSPSFAMPLSASSSRTSLAPKDNPAIRPSLSQNLSTSNAIFREVLAEEEDAKQNHILEEQTEATKSQTGKSWWTSWMFKKWQ